MRVVKPHGGHDTDGERASPSAVDLAWVLEHSGEAVFVTDLHAVVTHWNREAAALYGFSAEEAIGRALRTLQAAGFSEADYAALLERVRAGRPTSSVAERCKKSGEIVHVSIKTTPLLDDQGELRGEITIARDVTATFQKGVSSDTVDREPPPQATDPTPGLALSSGPTKPVPMRWALNEAPLNEILLGLALLAFSWISHLMSSAPGGIAPFWPGTAIASAVLIRLPRIRWISATVSIVSALLIANGAAAHRAWPIAALLTGIDVAEIAMVVAVFRAWRFPYPDISIDQAAILTGIFGVAVPGIAAIGGGLVLRSNFGIPFAQGSLQYWSSHAVGACILAPPILLFSVKGIRRLFQGKFLATNALMVLLCLVGCYMAIRYVRFPFVSMGGLLLIVAFRMGGLGASLISLGLALMITNLWMLGIRPAGLDSTASISGSLLGLPVLALLATVMPPIAVGLGSDARRAAARAARVSERRFREAMEHSPIGMLISDLNGKWTYTNIALQHMLGYTSEEFRALPPGGPSKAEDWRESETRWKMLISGEIGSYGVLRSFQHKDGHWIWAQVAVSILRNEEGLPMHLIAQIESLEARRRAEEKLAEERERLRITLHSIDDAVITTNAQTHITYINAAAESLFGVALSAVEGRRVDEVIHLLDAETSLAAVNLVAQSALLGKALRRERACLLIRADGTTCHVSDSVSPVLEATGMVSGMVIVFHDVTREVGRTRDLRHRAMHDPLTGLSNRAEFEEKLRQVFGRAFHSDRPAAVMAIDLDRFKVVNDAAGHAAGDAVLCKVAEACKLAVRSTDFVGRLGGDEFAIILDNCNEGRATQIGRQLLQALNPLEIEWGGLRCSTGASIGLAMKTAEMTDAKAWFEVADQACFEVKRQGRGQLLIGHAS